MPRGGNTRKTRPVLYVIGPSIAYVPLTKGQFALIDSEDGEIVGLSNWHALWAQHGKCFYAERSTGSPRSMHRLIKGADALTVDHVEPSRTLDNRRSNLRDANQQQQCCNQRVRSDNACGLKGVSFRPETKKWRAVIHVNRKQINLGHFDTAEAAYEARKSATTQYHGEFARTA